MKTKIILFDLIDKGKNKEDEEEFFYYQGIIKEKSNHFESVFHINEVTEDSKKSIFNKLVSSLENIYENETMYLHFTGHGVVEQNGKKGIAFLMWKELEEALIRLKNRNNLIVVNLMNTCESITFQNFSGFDKLWCCKGKTKDFFSPFDIYDVKNFDFEEFKKIVSKQYGDNCSENYMEIIK